MKALLFIGFILLLSCSDKRADPSKIYDQKYVDSTLRSLKDSLDKREQSLYDSLLNAEAERMADSLASGAGQTAATEDFNLKSPRPATKNLPEPTGPDYQFPDNTDTPD